MVLIVDRIMICKLVTCAQMPLLLVLVRIILYSNLPVPGMHAVTMESTGGWANASCECIYETFLAV